MSGREQEYVRQAFLSNYVAPAGPMIEAFEKEFLRISGFAHAVALSSGSAALHLALEGLPKDDKQEVWASTLTFIGSVSAAHHMGSKLVFFDSDIAHWTMDPNLLSHELKAAASNGCLPRAVIPTDLYGQSCDLDEITALCASYEVPVICDSAEAVGTLYKGRHAGRGALAAAFSFNGNKIITSSGGGLLASDDKDLIDRARYLSTQARQQAAHYEHTEVGFNYRLSNICAAIGLGQLQVLNERLQRRREIFQLYKNLLGGVPGITFMPEADYGRSTRWLTVILIDPEKFGTTTDDIRLALEEENIEARPLWKPMHLQPVFRKSRYVGGSVAERLYERGLCVPSGSQMNDEDVCRVAELIRRQAKSS